MVAAWLLGVCVFSLRLVLGWVAIERLKRVEVRPVGGDLCRRDRRPGAARLGISRPVRLLESALAEVPAVIGCLKPIILLPVQACTGLPAEQLEAILAHELAHIKRCDYAVNCVQVVVETLLFYHPAVWWMSRAIRRERERCCDDVAVSLCGDRFVYVKALTAMEACAAGRRAWRWRPARAGARCAGGSSACWAFRTSPRRSRLAGLPRRPSWAWRSSWVLAFPWPATAADAPASTPLAGARPRSNSGLRARGRRRRRSRQCLAQPGGDSGRQPTEDDGIRRQPWCSRPTVAA